MDSRGLRSCEAEGRRGTQLPAARLRNLADLAAVLVISLTSAEARVAASGSPSLNPPLHHLRAAHRPETGNRTQLGLSRLRSMSARCRRTTSFTGSRCNALGDMLFTVRATRFVERW